MKREKGVWLVGLVTVFFWVGSLYGYLYLSKNLQKRRVDSLKTSLAIVTGEAERRISATVDLVYGLRGFLETAKQNTFADWNSFVKSSQYGNRFLGPHAFVYAQRIGKDSLKEFETSLRLQGGEYRKYTVHPTVTSEYSLPIKYIQTTEVERLPVLGFDLINLLGLFPDLETSALENVPIMFGPTQIGSAASKSKDEYFVFLLPVYSDALFADVYGEERLKYLEGYVGALIRLDSLEGVVLGDGVRYRVFDGKKEIVSVGDIDNVVNSVTSDFSLWNRKFTAVLETDKNYRLSAFEEGMPVVGLLGIVFVNLLWLVTVYEILTSKQRAMEYAEMISKDLRKFKQAVDGVSDHVVITDAEGYINYANEAATAATGYTLQEMLGKKPALWGGQMSRRFYNKLWKTIKEDKRPFWGEVLNKRKSGEVYQTEVVIYPILDERRELIFFVGIERDMSMVRAVESLKSEFISLASHQLRTPLSAARWFTEMLLNGDAGKLSKLQEKYVKKIDQANTRQVELVNALLNVSKIDSGKIEVVPKPTDLRQMLEIIFADFRVDMVSEDKSLVYSIDKKIPNMMIDPDLIKHVYTNLLTNAFHYTNPGGEVKVRVFVKGGRVVTEIKDNGIGIPKEEQSRVYDKFFRASNAMRKVTEGSGLGLYLAKTIIESSMGKIWFKSEEGKGTTFWFSLPVKSIRLGKDR